MNIFNPPSNFACSWALRWMHKYALTADLLLIFTCSNCRWPVLIYLGCSEKKSSKRNIASKQRNEKSNIKTTKNPFPRQRQTHAQTSFSLRAFRPGFHVFFVVFVCFVMLSYFRMGRNQLKYRKNIRLCLFRSDQCKLYKGIQRHAIMMYRVYVYWQMIDVRIVSCKSAGSNMLQMT